MFSHSETSNGYSGCDVKFGDVSEVSSAYSQYYSPYGSEYQAIVIENKIKPTEMKAWFNFSNVTEINGLNNIDTSAVTTFENCFKNLKLTDLDLSKWDTSNATSMKGMFYGCYNLTNINYGDKFVNDSVANCDNMFWKAFDANPPEWFAEIVTTQSVEDEPSDFISISGKRILAVTADSSFAIMKYTRNSPTATPYSIYETSGNGQVPAGKSWVMNPSTGVQQGNFSYFRFKKGPYSTKSVINYKVWICNISGISHNG